MYDMSKYQHQPLYTHTLAKQQQKNMITFENSFINTKSKCETFKRILSKQNHFNTLLPPLSLKNSKEHQQKSKKLKKSPFSFIFP